MFQLGREATITAGGKKYTLSRLERRIIEQFRDWVAGREGDPLADVERLLPHLDPAQAKEMIAEARAVQKQLQAFSIGCPLAKKYLSTEVGQAELLYLMLLDKQPDVTREEAFQIWLQLGSAEYERLLRKAQGEAPGPKNGEPPAA